MDAAATAKARAAIQAEAQERIRYSQPMAPGDYMIFPDQQLQRSAGGVEADWQYPFRRSDLIDRGLPSAMERAAGVALQSGGKPLDLWKMNLTVGEAIRMGLIP